MKGPGHYIDALYNLARRGMALPFSRSRKSTHDNPLRRLGRAMAELEAKGVQWGKSDNPERRERTAIRRELGLKTGRAWRRWYKAARRADLAPQVHP